MKSSIKFCFLFVFLFSTHAVFAQKYIGFHTGLSNSGLYHFQFQKEESSLTDYQFKQGSAFGFFYGSGVDSNTNLRIEAQFKKQTASIEEFYPSKKMDYSYQLLNLNLLYSFNLLKIFDTKLSLLTGPSISYTLKAKESGFYHRPIQRNIPDSVLGIQSIQYEKVERHNSTSNDLSKFNFGWDIGLELTIGLSQKLDLMLQNRYNIYFTNFYKDSHDTFLVSAYLNLGLKYGF